MIVNYRGLLVLIVYACIVSVSQSNNMGNNMTSLSQFIDDLQHEREFSDVPFVVGDISKADSEAIKNVLLKTGSRYREKLVSALIEIGLKSHPLAHHYIYEINHPHIIGLLFYAVTAKYDSVSGYTLEQLRNVVAPRNLTVNVEKNIDFFVRHIDSEAILTLAKAKPPNAQKVIKAIAEDSSWNKTTEYKILKAAVNSPQDEDDFIQALTRAKTGEEFVKALESLYLSGTSKSLRTMCQYFRSPLLVDWGPSGPNGAPQKSVRLYIMDGLRYNFPGDIIFHSQNVQSDDDYQLVEKFCEERFGIQWSESRPKFLTILPVPL